MADIKTRDKVKGTIKTIDKAAVATERMKQAYISSKDKAEHSVQAKEHNAEEYASDKIFSGTENAVYEGVRQFDKAGRKGVKNTKENYHKGKDAISRFKEKRATQSMEKQSTVYNGRKSIQNQALQSRNLSLPQGKRPSKLPQEVQPKQQQSL